MFVVSECFPFLRSTSTHFHCTIHNTQSNKVYIKQTFIITSKKQTKNKEPTQTDDLENVHFCTRKQT